MTGWRARVRRLEAALLLSAAASVAAAAGAPPRCEQTAGNLIYNCGFAKGLQGWTSQAVTTLAFDSRHGSPAAGALRMTNQPASEAGAVTCVAVPGAATYELSGHLRRLDGPGECLAFLEEHGTADCSGGAASFHTVATEALVPGAFTSVSGSASLRPETVAVRAGFACYGEHDDDVQSVLLDNVVLRRMEAAPAPPVAEQ